MPPRSRTSSTPLPAPTRQAVDVLRNPMRFRILQALNGRQASPNQLAGEFGESVGAIAYHVRVLRDVSAIELVDTVQRRGATEHFYVARMRAVFTDDEFAQLDAETRRAVVAPVVKRITEGAGAGVAQGSFDRISAHASWVGVTLDEQAHAELAIALRELVERAVALEVESLERANDAQPRTRYELSQLLFAAPPEKKRRGSED